MRFNCLGLALPLAASFSAKKKEKNDDDRRLSLGKLAFISLLFVFFFQSLAAVWTWCGSAPQIHVPARNAVRSIDLPTRCEPIWKISTRSVLAIVAFSVAPWPNQGTLCIRICRGSIVESAPRIYQCYRCRVRSILSWRRVYWPRRVSRWVPRSYELAPVPRDPEGVTWDWRYLEEARHPRPEAASAAGTTRKTLRCRSASGMDHRRPITTLWSPK